MWKKKTFMFTFDSLIATCLLSLTKTNFALFYCFHMLSIELTAQSSVDDKLLRLNWRAKCTPPLACFNCRFLSPSLKIFLTLACNGIAKWLYICSQVCYLASFDGANVKGSLVYGLHDSIVIFSSSIIFFSYTTKTRHRAIISSKGPLFMQIAMDSGA